MAAAPEGTPIIDLVATLFNIHDLMVGRGTGEDSISRIEWHHTGLNTNQWAINLFYSPEHSVTGVDGRYWDEVGPMEADLMTRSLLFKVGRLPWSGMVREAGHDQPLHLARFNWHFAGDRTLNGRYGDSKFSIKLEAYGSTRDKVTISSRYNGEGSALSITRNSTFAESIPDKEEYHGFDGYTIMFKSIRWPEVGDSFRDLLQTLYDRLVATSTLQPPDYPWGPTKNYVSAFDVFLVGRPSPEVIGSLQPKYDEAYETDMQQPD